MHAYLYANITVAVCVCFVGHVRELMVIYNTDVSIWHSDILRRRNINWSAASVSEYELSLQLWPLRGKVTSPCRSRCTRCCRAGWGSRVPPGTRSTACRWNTRCATGAPQRRCTWLLPDLHASKTYTRIYLLCGLIHLHLVYPTVPTQMQIKALEIWAGEVHELSEWKHEHDGWLTGDGLGAAHALLCIQVAEAFEAVRVVFPGGEALTRQLLSAADA